MPPPPVCFDHDRAVVGQVAGQVGNLTGVDRVNRSGSDGNAIEIGVTGRGSRTHRCW